MLVSVGLPFFSGLISVGALAGLTSVVMILMLGQSRVLFAMSRDGLLPRGLADRNRARAAGSPARNSRSSSLARLISGMFAASSRSRAI